MDHRLTVKEIIALTLKDERKKDLDYKKQLLELIALFEKSDSSNKEETLKYFKQEYQKLWPINNSTRSIKNFILHYDKLKHYLILIIKKKSARRELASRDEGYYVSTPPNPATSEFVVKETKQDEEDEIDVSDISF